MKRTLLISVFAIACSALSSQSFEWARRAGLWAFDLGYAIATDNAGNVYIAGKYEMNSNFGGTTVGCAGNHDIYVAKYGPAGDFKWVRTAGGTGGDYAWAMACDAAGNVVITGEIESTVSFGSGVSLKSNGDNDIFVARYNTEGTLLWARKLGGGSKSDKGLGIALYGSNIYITGKFEGSGNFAGTTLSSAGGREIFLAAYSTDGTFKWVKKAGGPGNDEGYAIATDPAGNIYLTGYYSNTANFGGKYLTSKGGTEIFLAKYTSAGSILWVKSAGGTANDYGMGLKVDNAYRVFLTGGFRVKSTFGSYTLTASGGNADIFVARYDASGNPGWVRKAGGKLNDYGRALALDGASNIYITGNYGLSAAFGTTTLTGVDSAEIYFAAYDRSGNFKWALKAGGEVDKSDPGRYLEMGLSIATDPYGKVVASGAYRSATSFGSTVLKPWDHTEIYITKINPGGSSARTAMQQLQIEPARTASFCTGAYVTLRASGDTSALYIWKKDGRVVPGESGPALKAGSEGRYCAQMIMGEDTLSSDTTLVSGVRKITPQITASTPVFCSDSNSLLSASAGEGSMFQWKRNGQAIPGANSATFQPVLSGNYQVRVVQGACFGWSETMQVEIHACAQPDSVVAGVRENSDSRSDSLLIRIFPNPNNGKFDIEVNLTDIAKNREDIRVEVLNALGQLVYLKYVPHFEGYLQHHIEVDGASPVGMYFLRVTAGDITETSRMMLLR